MMNIYQLKPADISRLLYHDDPLHTGCNLRQGGCSEYDLFSQHLVISLAAGATLKHAVDQALHDFHGAYSLPGNPQAILEALNESAIQQAVEQQREMIKQIHKSLFPECYRPQGKDSMDSCASEQMTDWRERRKQWGVCERLYSVDTYRHAMDVYTTIPWYEMENYLAAIPAMLVELEDQRYLQEW